MYIGIQRCVLGVSSTEVTSYVIIAVTPKPGHQIIKEWNDLYLLVRDPPAKLDKKIW